MKRSKMLKKTLDTVWTFYNQTSELFTKFREIAEASEFKQEGILFNLLMDNVEEDTRYFSYDEQAPINIMRKEYIELLSTIRNTS